MKKNKIGIILISFINSFLIFFGYMISNLYFIQVFQILVSILLFKFSKIRITKSDKFYFIICVFLLFSSMTSGDLTNSLEFVMMFFLAGVQKILLFNISDWEKMNINFLRIFSGIHVVFTLLQFLKPDMIIDLNSVLLNSQNFNDNLFLLKIGAYAGITGQTGMNAFFITIYIILMSTKLNDINNAGASKNKFITYLGLLTGFGALLLTAKRMFLIISIVFSAYNFFSLNQSNNKANKIKILGGIVIIIIFVLLLNATGMFDALFSKNNTLASNNDLFNGRSYLWKLTFEVFKEHPILGIGINTLGSKYNFFTHNIYIQLLAEVGVVGFTLFISYFITNLKTKKKNNILCKYGMLFQLLFLIYGFSGNPLYGHVFITIYFLGICFSQKGEILDENRNINIQ